MMGLFCACKAKNNEEYKKVIKTRMNIMILLFIAGAITLVVSLLAEKIWPVSISEYMLGIYSGVGTGLMAASVILWIKSKWILADDEKLKKSRLSSTDERLQEISQKAFRMAASILLLVLYGVGLIGGLFYPILVKVILGMGSFFLIVYIIAYKVYEKRM